MIEINSQIKYFVLVLGSGGRETAITKYLSKECHVQVHSTYTNPQTFEFTRGWNSVGTMNPKEILQIAEENKVDLVIVGSENLLITGVSDLLTANGIQVLGPTKNLARIESSKIFSRRFLKSLDLDQYNPDFLVLRENDLEKVQSFWEKHNSEVVIKQDRLAGGKGVFVAGDHFQTQEEFQTLMSESFQKGDVLLEEKLNGIEFSVISLQDQKGHTLHFPPVRDFKRRNNKDQGPNTGGMGLVSLLVDQDNQHWILEAQKINQTVLEELEHIYVETNYSGFLYGSYMLTSKGLKVIEFNARMGDPEGIGLFENLQTSPETLVKHFVNSSLDQLNLEFNKDPYVVKYLVPQNYPKSITFSEPVYLPTDEELSKLVPAYNSKTLPRLSITHASLKSKSKDENVYLGSSRTLAVFCQDSDHISASMKINKVMELIQKLNPGTVFHYRTDIGLKALDWGLNQPKEQKDMYVLTYADAGVAVDTNEEVVEAIQKPVIETYDNPNALGKIYSGYGQFAGIVKLKKSHHLIGKNFPKISATIDGTGTKSLLVTQELGLNGYSNLGQDIVNHCTNDLMVQGETKPLLFLDYIASNEIKPIQVKKFLEGCSKACLESNALIVGGETAEMPDVYREGAHDLVGVMVGLIDGKPLNPTQEINPGDIVLALPSTGPHTNGYSLIRKVVEKVRGRNDIVPDHIMNDWLKPHKSYYNDFIELEKKKIKVNGFVHVTGGGLIKNPPRILPNHCGLEINTQSWTIPESFQYIQKETGIDQKEMMTTFNCGVGLLIVLSPKEYQRISLMNFDHLDGLWEIGNIIPKKISDQSVYLK